MLGRGKRASEEHPICSWYALHLQIGGCVFSICEWTGNQGDFPTFFSTLLVPLSISQIGQHVKQTIGCSTKDGWIC